MRNPWLLFLLVSFFLFAPATAQDNHSLTDQVLNLPANFNDRLQKKAARLDAQLTRETEKYLQKLARGERKLRRRLMKTDSSAAAQLFGGIEEQYTALGAQLKSASPGTGRIRATYLPYVDSLKTSLSFLDNNRSLLSAHDGGKITASLNQVSQLEGKLQQADLIREFIRQRKEKIKAALAHCSGLPAGITNRFGQYQKTMFYYAQQVQAYRNLLNDPDKLLTQTLSLLNRLPAFRAFQQKHSELAGLFAVPAGYANGESLTGLQTRSQVQELLQNQLGGAGPNVQQQLNQQLQSAQGQLNELKDKVARLGDGGQEVDIANFKPNNQKTKTFWKRLEYGSNLQTQRSNNFFPTTSDLGLSVGYKLTDNSVVGVVAAIR